MLEPAAEGDLLSTVDAADVLGVPEAQVAAFAGDGRLAAATSSVVGPRFRRTDVEELAAELGGRQFHHHVVQFYESHEFLHGAVAQFVARGLRSGAGALLILTGACERGVRQRLVADGLDVAAEVDAGRLLFVDAHEALGGIMQRGLVDAARFFALVGGVIDRMGPTPQHRLRAYGEMVDLLCGQGLPDAALQLEQLWDQVTRTQPLSLLCAYQLANLRVGEDSAVFERICSAHTRVALTERLPASDPAPRATDELLAMLRHELRNPLAPILLAVDLLRQRHGDAAEFAVIDRQVNHLARVVDELLDFARLLRGKVVLREQRVALADVVARGVELSPALAGARRQDLELRLPPGLQLEVDGEHIARALANVLTNAASYSEPGSKIVLGAEHDGASVRLSLRDHGIGIEPAQLERVFELFVRHEPPLDGSEAGLGLGLAIARKLVELHGGTVSARSAGIGHGSELLIVLPVRAQKR